MKAATQQCAAAFLRLNRPWGHVVGKGCKFAPRMTHSHQYKEILALGLPIIVGQLGTVVLGFADTLMIGRHSTAELAAAGFVNGVFSLVLLAYLGFSYGLTPIVGQLFGAGNTAAIGRKVRNSLAANLATGALLMALLVALYLCLPHLGQPEELLPLIRPYFIVNLISVPFVGVFNTLKQFFDAITRTSIPMWVMVGGNVANILFNWLLIYGVAGFPELGLLGAGISTMGSRIAMAAALCCVLWAGSRYRAYRDGIAKGRLNKPDFTEANRLGWPVALQMGMETAAFSVSSLMAGWLGTVALASHQVGITLTQPMFLVISGIAAAVAIRVSLFAGRGDTRAVRSTAYDGLRLLLAASALLCVPLLILRHDIGGIFTTDTRVQATVAQICLAMAAYQFGDSLQLTFAHSLRGIACVRPLVGYAFIAYFVIDLPLAYVLGFVAELGVCGIWWALPVGLTAAGMLYRRRFERELKKTGGKPAA